MKIVSWVSIMLLMFFPLCNSPVSLGVVLILASFGFVAMLSFFSSWWYSYILFLVYIGGLLVLFIYVCLISSNYPFSGSGGLITLFFLSSIISYSMSFKPLPKSFSGMSVFDVGAGLGSNWFLWVFMGLVVLLLVMLLVVVRASGAGSVVVK
uniref:NADH dehydrogenase subunit 6 n=1 Tax=Philine kinglipini TaxID=3030995 RepID=UPI002551DF59|nr:NADH dehydrogenase subunit 6 [Philine kinglipini]WFG53979.1 NADH dehydrogenase subunit 6 [Philine kinglipini]